MRPDEQITRKIALLHNECVSLAKKIDSLKKASGKLDGQLDSAKDRILEKRKNISSLTTECRNKRRDRISRGSLEKQLALARKKLNETQIKNAKRKQEINVLRRNRVRNLEILQDVKSELICLTKRREQSLKDMESNQAAKGEAEKALRTLLEEHDTFRKSVFKEEKELDEQAKRQNFEFEKNKKGNGGLSASLLGQEDSGSADSGASETENASERRRQAQVAANHAKMEDFERAFASIRRHTGIDDLDSIVKLFVRQAFCSSWRD